ncbi:helix-turn-helix domain-containing protein [Amycolatopsis sp. GM8]|uniref:helix-turn-helix domain-containing protein n=1 Tax=Amycolatopsis sp. GM8 TaxID=2896530 RepID=UPI001F029554|nr:helix-turn-helix domain-containing protein [Amycolatopsis sp. GM8]
MLKRVAALVVDQLFEFEFGMLCEVFGRDRRAEGLDLIDFRVCGVHADRPVSTNVGQRLLPAHGLDAIDGVDLLAVPATGLREFPEAALAAVRAAHAAGATVLTICSGVFLAGAAGLLDGRRCTAHWQNIDELRQRHPTARVDPDVLFVDEGSLVTSAGTAAGIDACLHIVRRELGGEAANTLARLMVAAPQREGGQRQFINRPLPRCADDTLAPLQQWMIGHLTEDIPVATLAARVHLSERTFTRRFVAETGTTPHRWLTHQRVAHAQRLLEETRLTTLDVALGSGFSSEAMLRHHFRQSLGLSPSAYRRAFHTGTGHHQDHG